MQLLDFIRVADITASYKIVERNGDGTERRFADLAGIAVAEYVKTHGDDIITFITYDEKATAQFVVFTEQQTQD